MSSGVNICIFLLLTLQGSLGSELTINVRKSASVTLVCSTREYLVRCCPSTPQKCHLCTEVTKLNILFQIYGSDKYYKLSGLTPGDSGLYGCRTLYQQGQKYRLSVLTDKNSTVVIGTVGQSIILSCGYELDSMPSSQKYWCRLDNTFLCQPDTLMGPENDATGDFKILASNSSFCLEKRQLTHNDTGHYRFTQIFPNYTQVNVVELQVKDKPKFLEISPVRVKPDKLQIKCQYSQEMEELSKTWLCDSKACPNTVRSVDDRFQSALVLTVDHAACSDIKSFQCVAKKSGSVIYSEFYTKPLNSNPSVDVDVTHRWRMKEQVKAYNIINLICYKPEIYYDHARYDMGGWSARYDQYVFISWCRVSSYSQCSPIKDNVVDTGHTLNLQICVTPNDDGTKYRCKTNRWSHEIEIDVIAPTPSPAPLPSNPSNTTPRGRGYQPSAGIIIIVISIVLLFTILLVSVSYKFKGQKLRERVFTRRTVLSAVDTHANMYANLVANYYSNNRQIATQPDKQTQGDNKVDSSSSDDEFEELPARPQRSSSVTQEETDYVRVKPGRAAGAQNVRYTSKTNKDRLGRKQRQGTASSSGHAENKEDEDDDEVTYTHVVIKPKQQPK